ncbi:hypothetical protein FA15DRAFT_758512 [Coprinopsis marcescibilis]|uniref:Uncharacterized protein n=1 Tax=Coprinopsis marcescibilis TaxID=230819 RepID=A0A5C3KNV1_COPMA|nr:hypothetical protein FA15DRAFT_758512 [Coprinopsis marcescibilis]
MPRIRRSTQTSATPPASQLVRSRHYHRRANVVLDGDTEIAEGNSVFLAPKEHTLEECRKPENHHPYNRAFVDVLYEHTGTGLYMVGSLWKHPDQLDPQEFDARDRAVVTQALIPFELIVTEEQRVWPVADIEAGCTGGPGTRGGKLTPVKEFCTCKGFYNVNAQQQRYCTTCLQWFCEVHCGSGSGPVRAGRDEDVGGLRGLPNVRGLGGVHIAPESWWRVVGSWSLGNTQISTGIHPSGKPNYTLILTMYMLFLWTWIT